MSDKLTIPMPICKACGKTIDIKNGIKEIETPFGKHEFYHDGCKSEWEKGGEFLQCLQSNKKRNL